MIAMIWHFHTSFYLIYIYHKHCKHVLIRVSIPYEKFGANSPTCVVALSFHIYLQKWPNYEAGFLIIMLGQSILFFKCKVSYFLFNNSLTSYTDVCSYYNESLQICFWIFQFTGHDFSNYTILAVRAPDFQPYRLYCHTI